MKYVSILSEPTLKYGEKHNLTGYTLELGEHILHYIEGNDQLVDQHVLALKHDQQYSVLYTTSRQIKKRRYSTTSAQFECSMTRVERMFFYLLKKKLKAARNKTASIKNYLCYVFIKRSLWNAVDRFNSVTTLTA